MTTATDPPRFTYYELPGKFHLAVNSNKKMKTIALKFSFVGNLAEDVATRLALVPMVLRRGTRRYPDMQQVSRFLEGLYGASLATSVHKIGEWHVARFQMEVVNERFLPDGRGVLRSALEFLRELLVDPLEVNGGFQRDFLEQEKVNLERMIESLVDSKSAYAHQRLIECMCPNEPFRIYDYGSVEAIPEIEAVGLRSFHRTCISDYPLHAYIAGDLDVEETRDLLAEVFDPEAFPRRGSCVLSSLPEPVEVKDTRHVEESMEVNQARLMLGYRHGVTQADPLYESLLVMNGVLGGFSHSKLFQNVREKANLCYSVHSGLERTKGLLFISSGIAPEKYDEARDIILVQVKALQDGDISDEEIAATVRTLLNHNEMLEDNLSALAEVDFTWRLHGRSLDLDTLRNKIRHVSRDDLVAVARRLALDTSYLLTGKKEEKGSRDQGIKGSREEEGR